MFYLINSLVYLQIVITGMIVLFCLVFYNFQAAYSALFGSLAWILPCFYFRRKIQQSAFPPRPRQTRCGLLINFYINEFIKLFSSAVLVIFFLKIFSINSGAFIIGYIAAVIAIWLLPFVRFWEKNRRKVY